jgi:excisionase family DNA binding protein
MTGRDFLTVAEAAAILGVSGRTIAYRLQKGFMRGEHVNPRLWVIPREEVEHWKSHAPLPRGKAAQRRRQAAAKQTEGDQ